MTQRILIVDDQLSIRFSVSEYLAAYGFEVDSAEDVPGALRLLDASAYDAVIADLRLGDSDDADGLEVISAARRAQPRPRIVLLSAYSSPLIEQHARRCGADIVLQKPLPLWELKDLLVRLIELPAGAPPPEPVQPSQSIAR